MTEPNGLPGAYRPPIDVTTPPPSGDHVALSRRIAQLTADLAAANARTAAAEDARVRAEAEARRQSLTDGLTGLLTRRGFLMQADLGWRLARRCGMRCALLFADIDGMAAVNASRGRPAGDELLRSAARVLRQTLRDADVVARLGGDEFAVFGPTGEGNATMLLSRLQDAVAKHNCDTRVEPPLALSVGAVDLQWSGSVTLETLLAEAERAMARGQRRRQDKA